MTKYIKFMTNLEVAGVKVEYTLTWVSCSAILVVTAVQVLNNEIDVAVPSDAKCPDLCHSKIGISLKSQNETKFGYGKDDGPLVWPLKSRNCSGKRQSPIDFDTTTSVIKYHPRLYWWNYNQKPMKMMLTNNGHTAVLKGKWENAAQVPSLWLSAGNFSESQENYVFEQLHFHWGSNRSIGSEHAINSLKFPLEMHAVHRKRKFSNIFEAMYAGDENVLVVAVLFQVSKHKNEGLTPIVAALKDIITAGSETPMKAFELRRLLPEFSSYFLMYNGSLTTPPCSEGVAWVVKLEISTISTEQLSAFRLLRNENNNSMSDNYRSVQPLNGRSVWHIK